MGRISRRVVNKEIIKEVEDQLSFMILSLTNKEDINIILNEFLTKEEKIMLGKRIVLYMMVYKGISNIDINNSLSVSYETIRSYKNLFENKPQIFKKRIMMLITREHNKKLWKKIENILEPLNLAVSAKTDMKARAKLLSRSY